MPSAQNLPRYANFIDGRMVPPADDRYLPTEDPYTGEAWATIARSGRPTSSRFIHIMTASPQAPVNAGIGYAYMILIGS